MHLENGWKMIAPTKMGEFKAHYFCKCGKNITLTLQNNDYPDYSCKNCHNNNFLTYETFQDIQNGISTKDINLTCKQQKNNDRFDCIASLFIPFFDYETASIHFKKRELARMFLDEDFQIVFHKLQDKDRSRFQDMIYQKMRIALLKYLYKKDNRMMKKIKYYYPDNSYIIEIALFMLQNPHLQDVELTFFYALFEKFPHVTTLQEMFDAMLQNQPKSVKKAFYQGYNDLTFCVPSYDFIILELFSDPNFSRELLVISPKKKKRFMGYTRLDEYLKVMNFLKTIFPQKKLFALLKEAFNNTDNLNLMKDTIDMLTKNSSNFDIITNELTLKQINIQNLHDKIADIVNFYLSEEPSQNILKNFEYPQEFFNLEYIYKGLEFRLVKNPKELYDWAKVLHNCLSGYTDKVSKNGTIIIGIFFENTITYALELKKNRLIQARAKYNKPIPKHHKTVVDEWCGSNKIAF